MEGNAELETAAIAAVLIALSLRRCA